MQPLKNAAIRMMLEAGVLDFIARQHGQHVSAKALAEKTGYDELLIGKFPCFLTQNTRGPNCNFLS